MFNQSPYSDLFRWLPWVDRLRFEPFSYNINSARTQLIHSTMHAQLARHTVNGELDQPAPYNLLVAP